MRAEVRGHDDDRVLEVHRAPLGVGQAAVVEQLEQDVEDVVVRLLDLVEEEDGVRLAAHRLGELPALLVADVARRGADEPGDGVALHVLGHVDAHERLLAVEEGLGERLGELGLADPGRAEEEERADRAARVLDAGAGADHRVGDQPDRLVLADYPPVEDLVEAQELLPLRLHEAGDRDPGPAGDDLGHLGLADALAQEARGVAVARLRLGGCQTRFEPGEDAVLQLGGTAQVGGALGLLDGETGLLDLLAQPADRGDLGPLLLPLGAHRALPLLQVGELAAQVGEPFAAPLVALLGERLLLDLELEDPAGDLVELGGQRVDLGADHRARLVDQVDRLVGQETVGDVPVREDRGRHERAVLDLDAVVDLEALFEAPQDRDGVLDARGVDEHRLEPPLERGVLLDLLPVLVERGGADAVELAAREHRLEEVRGVGGALGLAGADDGVELVDEEDHPPVALADLVEHRLEPFFELAAVLRAREQRPHVERPDGAVGEPLGHVPLDDPLREPLDHRGLADPGLADEDRVVLRPPREDPDDAPDLGVAADDRVELPRPGLPDEVGAVLLQRLVGGLRGRRGDALAATHRDEGGEEPVAREPGAGEEPPGGGRLPLLDEGEQEVLDRDVLVLEPLRLRLGGEQQALEPLRDVDLARLHAAARDARAAVELGLELARELVSAQVGAAEQAGDEPVGLGEEGEGEVFAVDLLLAAPYGFGLGALERLLGSLGEPVQVHRNILNRRTARGNWRSRRAVRRVCAPHR